MSESTQSSSNLSGKDRIYYSLTAFGVNLPLSLFTGFNYYYMVYIIGLGSTLVSVVTSIALFLNALGSPVFGYLSDNISNIKRGKRRPFLLYGAPLLSVFFFLTWFYPSWLNVDAIGETGVAIIYFIAAPGFSLFNAFVWAPYIAMLPEISQDDDNRIQISSVQGIFNLVATILGIIFPFLIKGSFSDSEIIDMMILVSSITVVVIMVTIYLTYFNIREPIQDQIQNTIPSETSNLSVEEMKKSTIQNLIADFKIPLNNQNFRFWIVNAFIFNLGMKIPLTILIPYLENVLGIVGNELIVFIGIALPFAVLGYFLWIRLSSPKRLGLSKTLIVVYLSLTILILITSISSMILPIGSRKFLGSILIICIITVLIATFIIPNPLISKIIDEEMLKQSRDNPNLDKYSFSGKFFGVHSFFLYIAQSIGVFLIGPILEGREESATTLIILLLISGIVILFAVISLRKIHLEQIESYEKSV